MASGGSRRGDQYTSEAGVLTWGCGDAKWTFVALSLHGPFSTPHHPSGRDDKAAHLALPADVLYCRHHRVHRTGDSFGSSEMDSSKYKVVT
jgi:hypothetical protein